MPVRLGHVVLGGYSALIAGLALWSAAPLLLNRESGETISEEAQKDRAARALPANHLLVAGDVNGPNGTEWLTRYLKAPKQLGEPLTKDDLAERPALPHGAALAGVPVSRDLVERGIANAGRILILCMGEQPSPTAVSVQAVLCRDATDAGASGRCTAMLDAGHLPEGFDLRRMRAAADTCRLTPAPSREVPPTPPE